MLDYIRLINHEVDFSSILVAKYMFLFPKEQKT